MAYKKERGNMIYEGYEDHRGRTGYALVLFIFLLTVRRIRMFFSLKPSAPPGKSSYRHVRGTRSGELFLEIASLSTSQVFLG